MGHILAALESLPWSSIEIPLGYQRAAAELEAVAGAEVVDLIARGFVENHECVVCLTSAGLRWAAARALSAESQRWDFTETKCTTRSVENRLLVELRAPGRRSVLRLIDEDASQRLVERLVETVDPTPQISFRPYMPRA